MSLPDLGDQPLEGDITEVGFIEERAIDLFRLQEGHFLCLAVFFQETVVRTV
jgi:hypothetical protein